MKPFWRTSSKALPPTEGQLEFIKSKRPRMNVKEIDRKEAADIIDVIKTTDDSTFKTWSDGDRARRNAIKKLGIDLTDHETCVIISETGEKEIVSRICMGYLKLLGDPALKDPRKYKRAKK